MPRDHWCRLTFICALLVGLPLVAVVDLRRPAAGKPLVRAFASQRSAWTGRGRFEPDPAASSPDLPQRLPAAPIADQAWFRAAQNELRRLGAVYVRLEKWHSEPAVYYFECQLGHRLAAVERTEVLSSLSASPEDATEDVLWRLRQRHQDSLAP